MATTSRSARIRTTTVARLGWAVTVTMLIVVGSLAIQGSSRGDETAAKSRSKSPAQKAKQSAQPVADDGAVDDGGSDDSLETDEDLTAFVVPADLLAKPKSIDKLTFAQALRGLLMEGMAADGDSVATAKRQFESARKALADDPRAPYAYGISLLSQDKPKEALEQFRAAASISPALYLPALQGIAWVCILKNDYAKGFPAIHELARKTSSAKGPWPTDHDRRHSAEWVGRMTGYLSGPGKPSDHAAEIERLADDLDKLFTGELKEAYEHGRKSIAGRHEKMKALAARPVNEVLAEARQRQQEARSAAETAAAELKRLEDELLEITKPHEKQNAEWSQELRTAATNHKQAARDLAVTSEQVAYLSTPQVYPQVRTTGSGRYRRQVMSTRAENAQEKKTRETQLASARQRAQQAQSTFDQSRQEMTDIKSQRAKAATEHGKTMSEKRPLISEARKISRELAAHAKDIERLALTPEKIKSRVTALETYVPLDPEIEKSRLLATLK